MKRNNLESEREEIEIEGKLIKIVAILAQLFKAESQSDKILRGLRENNKENKST